MFFSSSPSLPSNTILQFTVLILCLSQVQNAVCSVGNSPNIHNDAIEIISFLKDKTERSNPPKSIEYPTEAANPNKEESKPSSKVIFFRKTSFSKKRKEQDEKIDVDNNAYPASKNIPEDSLFIKVMKVLGTISIHLYNGKNIYDDTDNVLIEYIETEGNIKLFELLSKADKESLQTALAESKLHKKEKTRWKAGSSFSIFRKHHLPKEEASTSKEVLDEFKRLINKFSQDENTLNNPTKNTQSFQNDTDEKSEEKMNQQDSMEEFNKRRKTEQEEELNQVCKINWKLKPQSAPPGQVKNRRVLESLKNYRAKHPQNKEKQNDKKIINPQEYSYKTRATSLKYFPDFKTNRECQSDTEAIRRSRKHSKKTPKQAQSVSSQSRPTSERSNQRRPASVVYLGQRPNNDRPSSAPPDKANYNRKTYHSQSNPKQPKNSPKKHIQFKYYGTLNGSFKQKETSTVKVTSV